MIAAATIENIRNAAPISDVVAHYVDLRRTARGGTGLCPFHNERTPSFHTRDDRGFFKCFGCGEGGDVFAFVSKSEHIAFPAAIARVAQLVGQPPPDTRQVRPPGPPVRTERQQLWDFHKWLRRSELLLLADLKRHEEAHRNACQLAASLERRPHLLETSASSRNLHDTALRRVRETSLGICNIENRLAAIETGEPAEWVNLLRATGGQIDA